MPQLIVWYDENAVDVSELRKIGHKVRPLVAKAVTTNPSKALTEKDIDWFPQQYPYGMMADCGPVMIELRMIGLPLRKEKLCGDDNAVLRNLKQEMLDAGFNRYLTASDKFLWVQFTDGPHL